MTSGRLAPYVEAVRGAGSAGTMVRSRQPAGDVSDPATSDLVLLMNIGDRAGGDVDWGFGRNHFDFHPGSLAFQPAFVPSRIQVADPHHLLCLALPAADVQAQVATALDEAPRTDFGVLHSSTFRNDLIGGLMRRLWDVSSSDRPSTRLYGDSAVTIICAELAQAARQRVSAVPRHALAPAQLRKVKDYIEDHLAEDTGLQELADLVGLSRFHFCRAFKAATGMPPHAWRRARRIERAQLMLAHTGLPVSEIAASVGYDDPSYLAHVFRRWLGVTPQDYRRAARS